MKINVNLGKKCLFSKYKLLELTTKENLDKILANQQTEDDSLEIAKIFSTKMHVSSKDSKSNICFMDMRGKSELKPADSARFEFLIFGGILGDHPPQDRGKDLRSNFANVRHLGPVQMTTDTALLVSREILEQECPLESLKFVTNPAIPCDSEVKAYLDMAIPHSTLADEKF